MKDNELSWMDFEHVCPECGADEEASAWDTDGFRQCGECGIQWNITDGESFGRMLPRGAGKVWPQVQPAEPLYDANGDIRF